MKRKLLFILMALLPLVASAYDAEIDGIYYNFSGDQATVTYKNTNYNSYSGIVVIPESVTYNGKTYSVTSIGYSAFEDCSSLTSITIPEGVTSIEWNAFYVCRGLTSVNIPKSVTRIGDGAFGGCSGLTSMKVETGNTKYDSRNDCNAIIEKETNTLISGCQNTVIPNSVTSIGDDAFSGCSSLTSITIPESVTSIGDYAFEYCSSLASVTIGNSVTSIGEWAFRDCSSLASVTIGNSVTSIGRYAFNDCSGLTSIKVETGNTKYDSRNDCNAIIETETNTLILGCQNTIIPEGVTSIGERAFRDCSSLTSITIPEGVTSIGEWAFSGCSVLASITIPESVNSIGDKAFGGCYFTTDSFVNNSSLTDPNNWGATLCDEETSDGLLITNGTLIKCRPGITSATIPEGVTSISDYAFYGCISLTSINIPDSVTSIGTRAFAYCSGLTSITIPEGVTSISYGAFQDCISLTSITIPEGVTRIGNSAFGNCNSLTSINIPNSVTSIGNYAFYGCSGLTSVTIGNGVRSIGDYAFSGCSNLTSVSFSSKEYGTWFSGLDNLREVILGDGVVVVARGAFKNCPRLTSLTISETVKYVYCSLSTGGGDTFEGTHLTSVTFLGSPQITFDFVHGWYTFDCPTLKSVYIYDLEAWCKKSFYYGGNPLRNKADLYLNDSKVTNLVIPDGITEISAAAFEGCQSIQSVTISPSVTTVCICAFANCSFLKNVWIPESVTYIEEYAFANCTDLTDVYCAGEQVPQVENSNIFDNVNLADAVLHVPASAIEQYKATAPWSDFGKIVPLTTSINSTSSDTPSNNTPVYYDLNGRRVTNPGKGIYIKNGKKVAVK